MNIHTNALTAFLFWLAAVAVGIVTYITYLGPPGMRFIQIAFLSSLLALSVIYFLLRASRLGKNWVAIPAAAWFIGSSVLFTVVPSVDARVLVLILLAIGISLNVALSVVFRRRAGPA